MKCLTPKAKQAIIEKALLRNKDQNIASIAVAHNIGVSTLERWVKQSKNGTINVIKNDAPVVPQFTCAEQLKHLLATASLTEEQLGSYCRERGLYSFQLQQCKEKFMSQDNQQNQQNQQKYINEIKTLKLENKSLKYDLNRKEKALAETAALLVLKKKVNLIWGEQEDV